MNPTTEAAIGTSDDVFAAGDCGIAQDAVGNQLRVLDKVGGVTDAAGHQHLARRQLDVLPDAPLMFVPHVGGFEGIGLRFHLERMSIPAFDLASPNWTHTVSRGVDGSNGLHDYRVGTKFYRRVLGEAAPRESFSGRGSQWRGSKTPRPGVHDDRADNPSKIWMTRGRMFTF